MTEPPTVEFEAEFETELRPPPLPDFWGHVHRWLNQTHCGQDVAPVTVTEVHRAAAYQSHRLPRLRVKLVLDRSGNWKVMPTAEEETLREANATACKIIGQQADEMAAMDDRAKWQALQEKIARLEFVLNFVRLPLSIDPAIKNDDVPAMLAALQKALGIPEPKNSK